MIEVAWQLPVRYSSTTNHDWIHPKAKYHAFLNYQSACGRYAQDTDYFETSIKQTDLMQNKELACKKCLKKIGLEESP